MPTGYSSADLHLHTTASDGTASPTEVLAWVAEQTDLKVVAICDHNTNEGALEAAAVADRYGVEVVVGQEVESSDGHILGLWTPTLISPGMPAETTVAEIHRQGGLAIAAHPYAPKWWAHHGLCRGETEVYDSVDYDGIEVANSTPLLFFANFHARRYWSANASRLAATGGSDAHILSAIGTSRTLFPGTTAAELRFALETRTTRSWGPSFDPARSVAYARKVREIQARDRESRLRAEQRVAVSGCDACDSAGDASPSAAITAESADAL
jgi:predicted metal-dependent phosphoesterase TrpH